MKKLVLTTLMALSLLLSNVAVLANDIISVYLNGEKMQFDQNPIIENGYTLVPMRTIFEALDADVNWDKNTRTVIAKKDKKTMMITVDETVVIINEKDYKLDVPARNIEGRVLVPLRFISEQLNVGVDWNQDTKTITLTTNVYKDFEKYPGMTDIRSFLSIQNFEEIEKDNETIYKLSENNFSGSVLDDVFKYYEYLEKEKGFKYIGKVSDNDLGEKCYQYKSDNYTLTISIKDGDYYCKVSNNK